MDMSKVPGWEGAQGPGPGQYDAPHVYARDVQSGSGNCSYLSGKVAPRIRWGTGGDFKRCVRQGRKHGMESKAEGACARLHKTATGQWPGRGRRH